ncbi:MAG TPA: UPF0179 family protein [Candidatus Methanofastidiosa archaeon]|nr:UPF0179 family protein [Candidatus Methanofastidiosa archaeon]
MMTLIGESMARKGMKFVFEGTSEACDTCKLRFTCANNLEKGRVYEIVDVKKVKHYCPKEDDYLTLVEIVEPALEFALDKRKAINGMSLPYSQPCRNKRCKNWDTCVPIGLSDGEKVLIKKIKGDIECPEGSKKLVEVERL